MTKLLRYGIVQVELGLLIGSLEENVAQLRTALAQQETRLADFHADRLEMLLLTDPATFPEGFTMPTDPTWTAPAPINAAPTADEIDAAALAVPGTLGNGEQGGEAGLPASDPETPVDETPAPTDDGPQVSAQPPSDPVAEAEESVAETCSHTVNANGAVIENAA